MALFDNSTINTNVLASALNLFLGRSPVPMAVKRNAVLYALLGKHVDQNVPFGVKKTDYSGDKLEWRLMGSVATTAFLASGSAEIATRTRAITNFLGNPTLDVSHIAYKHDEPASRLMKIAGKSLKFQEQYLTTVAMYLEKGWENDLGNSLHSNAAASETVFGGLPFAMAGASGTYATILRTDAANVDFTSYVEATATALTRTHLYDAINNIVANNGNPRVGCAGLTLYRQIEILAEGLTQIHQTNHHAEFGYRTINFGGVDFTLDQRTLSGRVYILDPESWEYVSQPKDSIYVDGNKILYDTNTADSYVIPISWFGQLACIQPNLNAQLTGKT